MGSPQRAQNKKERVEKLKVIKPHRATDELQLELQVGQIVHLLEKDASGWWGGHLTGDDCTGWFPAQCVEPIIEDDQILKDTSVVPPKVSSSEGSSLEEVLCDYDALAQEVGTQARREDFPAQGGRQQLSVPTVEPMVVIQSPSDSAKKTKTSSSRIGCPSNRHLAAAAVTEARAEEVAKLEAVLFELHHQQKVIQGLQRQIEAEASKRRHFELRCEELTEQLRLQTEAAKQRQTPLKVLLEERSTELKEYVVAEQTVEKLDMMPSSSSTDRRSIHQPTTEPLGQSHVSTIDRRSSFQKQRAPLGPGTKFSNSKENIDNVFGSSSKNPMVMNSSHSRAESPQSILIHDGQGKAHASAVVPTSFVMKRMQDESNPSALSVKDRVRRFEPAITKS